MEQSGAGKHVRTGIAVGWRIIQGDNMMPVLLSTRQDGHHASIYEKIFGGMLLVVRVDGYSPRRR